MHRDALTFGDVAPHRRTTHDRIGRRANNNRYNNNNNNNENLVLIPRERDLTRRPVRFGRASTGGRFRRAGNTTQGRRANGVNRNTVVKN